eukprot:87189-Pyramimonas_sp.AAC.1
MGALAEKSDWHLGAQGRSVRAALGDAARPRRFRNHLLCRQHQCSRRSRAGLLAGVQLELSNRQSVASREPEIVFNASL